MIVIVLIWSYRVTQSNIPCYQNAQVYTMYVKECIKSAIKRVLLPEKRNFKQVVVFYTKENKTTQRKREASVGQCLYMFVIILWIKLAFMAANTSTYLP